MMATRIAHLSDPRRHVDARGMWRTFWECPRCGCEYMAEGHSDRAFPLCTSCRLTMTKAEKARWAA